jgi:outer membrane protein OmpA-like peptidoglycan-associated protein
MKNLFPFFLLFLFVKIQAQEPMEVLRTAAVDRYSPVYNVFIDADNNKWVGNRKGLFQVHSAETSSPIALKPDEWSLLQTRDGNADLRFPLADLLLKMGEEGKGIQSKQDRITTAIFDEKRKEMWVGTKNSGLFQFKTEPALSLVKRHHSGNSKLASNQINTLFFDQKGQLWIGTGEGALYGPGDNWSLAEKDFNIRAFAQNGTDVWVMGDGLLWKVDARGKWSGEAFSDDYMEGTLVDIAFDQNGLLWAASEIVARFDPATGEAQLFGPIEYFTSQDVACIAVDKDNSVWIGTNDKGLYLIQKASTLYVTLQVDKDLGCNSSTKNAALKVTVSGGQEPYKYQWSGPDTGAGLSGATPANLGPGEYALTVTDAAGKTKTAKTAIADPNMTLTMKVQKQAGEDGAANGSATVDVKGGKAGYDFKWDNGETTNTAVKLAEGTHSVTVTDEAGCTATASVNVPRKIGELALAIVLKQPVKCEGGKEAVLEAQVSGGKTPYQYQWNITGVMQGASLSGLGPGTYALTLTDAVGQSSTAEYVVEAPKSIEISTKVESPASTGKSDGKASAKATGGSGSFSYKWDNGETSDVATKLAPGTHTVTVTDAAGCSNTASVAILENILPLAVQISQKTELKCAGAKDAALQASASGGKGPFKYLWSSSAQSDNAMGLIAGDYSVTVTDATGATATAAFSVKEPKLLSVSVKADSPASTGNADGKASAKATGGTGKYSFRWDTGETGEEAKKLGPGEHLVTVTDEAGCVATGKVAISENILPLAANISQSKELKCAGSADAVLKAEVSGGKAPFKYQWTGGAQGEAASNLAAGDYALTISDATGATATAIFSIKEPKPLTLTAKADAPASTGNADGKASAKASGGTGKYVLEWDNGETGEVAKKLAPGAHSIKVTDENGCTATATLSITENILPLAVNLAQANEIKCAGAKEAVLKAEVSGGKAPFAFAWSSGANTETVANLGLGNYSVTVSDAAGNTAVSQFFIKEPKPLVANAKVDAPASTGNADGKATVTASGGTGNFSYLWANGETAKTALKLAPGEHQVTVTDEAGCQATASVSISENILALTAAITTLEPIKCSGGNKAALQAEVSGGKGPFTYQWSGGQNGSTLSNLGAGQYNLTVTDATGTTATAKTELKEPEKLTVVLVKNRPATTLDTKNGKASLKASGGTGEYAYKWDNGETTAEAAGLGAGLHSITVSDANGCEEVVKVETKTRINPELASGSLRSGQLIKLEKIYFQADSTNMDPESIPTVEELYEFLVDNPGITIEVGGHTNGIPSHEYCDRISTDRAKAVAQYLVDKGIPTNRLTYKGYGKRNPIANNATAEGRAKNQRVEVKIVNTGDGG